MISIKKILTQLAVFFPLSAVAVSQTQVPDSTFSVELEAVTVKASPIIRKTDRDVYLPSAKDKERSIGGLSLLDNMQLPGVGVNTYLKTVSVNGETPEFRINNRRTTIEKVMSLDASTIARVEIINNPGVRYGDVPAVINIVVKNPETGGYAMLSGEQGLTKMNFGNYNGTLNINHGSSQFEINGYSNMRNNVESTRKYHESFLMPGQDRIYRTLTDTLGNSEFYWGNINLAYSYSRTDRTNFYVSIGGGRNKDSNYYEGRIDMDDKLTTYNDKSSNLQNSPKLHVYLDQNIGRKQTLVFDIDATMGFGRNSRENNEISTPDHNPVLSIDNKIRNRSTGLSAEAIYIKEWSESRLTTGVNYKMSRNREEYLSGGSGVYHQRTNREAFFAEYMHKIGNVSLTGGIRGEFWSNVYVENAKTVRDFLVTPDFSMTWSLKGGSMLRLNYSSYTTSPSLTETSEVMQTVDAYQVQVGNPNLKPYQTYNIGLTYAFNSPRFSGNIYARWIRIPNAIMEYSDYTPAGLICNSWLNAVGGTRYEIGLSPRIVIIPNFLTINGMVGYYHFRNHGPNYRLIENSLGTEVTAQFTYRDFTLSAYIKQNCRNLWGQTVVRFENFHLLNLSYHYRHFNFSASVLNPIGRYHGEAREKRSEIAWSKVEHHYTCEGAVVLGLSYSIDWGRKKGGVNRRTYNSADIEQVKAAGK